MTSIRDFKFDKLIGKGSYGTVYKATKKDDNQVYAIKKIKIISLNHYEKKYVINEIRILASHICNNLINYFSVFLNTDYIYLITEYAPNGDLHQLIKKHKLQSTTINEHEIWTYFIQICLGLQYLHTNNIMHRDIKSANIFIDSNNQIKLGDFGIIKIMPAYMTYAQTQIGTPYYMAPEIYKHERYNEKCDIWSLGCVLYEMMFLTQPFISTNIHDLKYKILSGKYNTNLKTCNSIELKTVLKSLLTNSAHQRPSIKDILKKPQLASRMKNTKPDTAIKSIFNDHCIVPQKIDEWKQVINKFAANKSSFPKISPKPISAPLIHKSKETKLQLIPTPPIQLRVAAAISRPLRRTKTRNVNNKVNEELLLLNKQIKNLEEDINNHKKKLNIKLDQLNYYIKKRVTIMQPSIQSDFPPVQKDFPPAQKDFPPVQKEIISIQKAFQPIQKETHSQQKEITSQIIDKKIGISPKSNLLIKIGSRHEPNYFLKIK